MDTFDGFGDESLLAYRHDEACTCVVCEEITNRFASNPDDLHEVAWGVRLADVSNGYMGQTGRIALAGGGRKRYIPPID